MLNELLDVVAKGLIERILNNEDFMQQLAGRIKVQDAVDAAIDAHDFSSAVEEAVQEVVNGRDMERTINDAVETAVEHAVDSAMNDLDVEDTVEKALRDFEFNAEQITDFDEAVCNASGLDEAVIKAVREALSK